MADKHMYHGSMRRNSGSAKHIRFSALVVLGLILMLLLVCFGLAGVLFIGGTGYSFVPAALSLV